MELKFREALGHVLSEQLRQGLLCVEAVAFDVGEGTKVFSDAGVGCGATLAGAVWLEIGRLNRESTSGWWTTGMGVVLEDSANGGSKFAMGTKPQVLSGEKHGPMGTASVPLEQRVGEVYRARRGRQAM